MIKRTSADNWFSKCVRERADYFCQACGKQYDKSSMGLHCSHYFGRRNMGVRYDPLNAMAHCYGCHQKFGSNPEWFHDHYVDTYGEAALEILKEKVRCLDTAKLCGAKNKAAIGTHYRKQHAFMLELRADGETGWLEFQGWV